MRFFKRRGEDAPENKTAPYVDGDVVYDESGEVIFDPTIAAAAAGGAVVVDSNDHRSELDTISRFDSEFTSYDEIAETLTEEAEEIEPVYTADDLESTDYASEPAMSDEFNVAMDDDQDTIDVTTTDIEPVETAPEPRTHATPDLLSRKVNLGEIRMDVARITSDIQSGERLYQRAQQRVESLMGFVERAEVDFSLLNRLEPENRRLKARNRVLESENEANEHSRRRLQRELEESLAKLDQFRADLEAKEAKLRATSAHLAKREQELKEVAGELEQSALRMERTQTSVEVESRENIVLRDQITDLSTRLDEVTAERMELAKMVESLKIDCDDFRAQKDQAAGEVSDLRSALATAQKVNGEMKSRMIGLRDEIKGFKTQYEFNVISRDDRIMGLEARIADLTKQLRIKEDVTKSALNDVAQLRKSRSAQDLERERLERVIETQQRQLDDAQSQINRSSASMAQLDQRYNDVAAALSVHQKRLTPTGEGAVLADPPPFKAVRRDDEPVDEDLTPENVEDLITDYKLGLRDKIA